MADILAPCILDARKTVTAWNSIFPKDRINTDPYSIYAAAINEEDSENTLHILTGVTKSSSFIGCVNFLKDKTEN